PPPKILVDSVTKEIKLVEPLGKESAALPPEPRLAPQGFSGPSAGLPAGNSTSRGVSAVPASTTATATKEVSAPSEAKGFIPPPPEAFPEGWETAWQAVMDEWEIAERIDAEQEADIRVPHRQSMPTITKQNVAMEAAEQERGQAQTEPSAVYTPSPRIFSVSERTLPEVSAGGSGVIGDPPEAQASASNPALGAAIGVADGTPPVFSPPPFTLPSLYRTSTGSDSRPPRQITLFLRPSGDKERDRRRIRTLFGILISHHGHDRFSFHITERGRAFLIDFPNETTRISPSLLTRLREILGEEAWRIEEIQ
ncbi:MAG: hypothetical protein ACK8QZ_04175, partial [Anaerolineales bacterium]